MYTNKNPPVVTTNRAVRALSADADRIAKILNFIKNPGKGGTPLKIKIKSDQVLFSAADPGPALTRGLACSEAPKNLSEKKIRV